MRIEFVDHQNLAKLADSNLLSVTDSGELDEIKAVVRAAIKRLPQYQQTIITMYYFEDASFDQIVIETGLPPKQIRKLLSNAKTKLKYSLKKVAIKRWPSLETVFPTCPICLHKRRPEIDRMIRKKPCSQSWQKFNLELFNEFGLKINPPILLKYHLEYHQKG